MDSVQALARQGVRRLDVVCPGFVADCLETLEEIAMENRDAFLAAGGQEFHAIACLNDRADWIHALADLALANLGGWTDAPADTSAGVQTRQRALAAGSAD